MEKPYFTIPKESFVIDDGKGKLVSNWNAGSVVVPLNTQGATKPTWMTKQAGTVDYTTGQITLYSKKSRLQQVKTFIMEFVVAFTLTISLVFLLIVLSV